MGIPNDGQRELGLMVWERAWEVTSGSGAQREQRCGGGASVCSMQKI